MTTTKFVWNEENTAVIAALAGETEGNLSYAQIEELAETIGTSVRSVGSKARSLGFIVEKKPSVAPTFTEEEGDALADFAQANSGKFNYAEMAEAFMDGAFSAKQIQGKLLALELTGTVKPTVHEKVSKYNATQEAVLVRMANAGDSIEFIAETLGMEVKSVRGKALSLLRAEQIKAIPHTATPKSIKPDTFDGIDIQSSTVEKIAELTGKTERGVKAMLTRRDLTCADYAPKNVKVAVAA